MIAKALKEALKSGRRVYGTLIVSPSPKWLDIVSDLNLDFVFIDTEHIAIDRHQLSWMCHGYLGKGIAPLVRIRSPDPYQASMVLDGGAQGVVVPYVETVAQVQELRGAVKMKPLKGQRLENYLQGREKLESTLSRYLERSNEDHILVVNIESRPAMANLDRILEVPGLDAVLIGPHDLSCSLGIPEQYDHPDFLNAVEKVFSMARKAQVGAGMHVTFAENVDKEIEWAKMGANLIIHGGDINSFARHMSEDIITMRKALNDDFSASVKPVNI